MTKHHRICSRCIMDTTVPGIIFDDKGECNYCKLHDKFEEIFPQNELGQQKLNNLIEKIKRRGRNKKYDCAVGFSGGTDSTTCLYLAKKWSLRPLVVHVDNGWDTDIAVNNMKKATEKLGLDLRIIKVDWEEFKDLEIAFLKASVPDIEIPTDIGCYAVMRRVAAEEGIRYIIYGHSFRTEGTQPLGWTYMDGKYIEDIYKKFSKNKKLKNFPNLKISNLLYFSLIKRIKEIRPLEYIEYDKAKAGKFLERELGWQYYGGHHYESIITRFLASYILIKKFNIDKRKVSFSARIRTGKITREKALEKIKEPPFPEDKVKEDMDYVLNKLGLTKDEFDEIMTSPIKSFLDYSTYFTTIRKLRFFIKVACKLKLVPEVLYEKYAKRI